MTKLTERKVAENPAAMGGAGVVLSGYQDGMLLFINLLKWLI